MERLLEVNQQNISLSVPVNSFLPLSREELVHFFLGLDYSGSLGLNGFVGGSRVVHISIFSPFSFVFFLLGILQLGWDKFAFPSPVLEPVKRSPTRISLEVRF